MSVDEILTSGVVTPVSEVTSWLGGQPLGEIPIAQGTVLESSSGNDALGRLEITVPATDEWIPSHPGHPLAGNGQELLVRRGFRLPGGGTVGWETLGRFRVWSADPEDGWISVGADSIDVRLDGARWIVATRTTGTYAAHARQICSGIVPIRIDATDRSAQARTWPQQDPRRDSLLELCDAWGTVPRMVDGQLTIMTRSTSTVPARTVRTGPGGTATKVAPIYETDRIPNVVVAMTAPEDGTAPLQAMAVVEDGPRRWDGPYGQEVLFYASPLLRTRRDCQAAATTRLQRRQAAAPQVSISCVTDPRNRLDTVLRVIDDETDTDLVMRVSEVTHALTPGREPGEVRGQVLRGRLWGQPW